eukprot:COSAG06_NODE_4224_length_4453_cov_275.939136_6_plen_80_part_00
MAAAASGAHHHHHHHHHQQQQQQQQQQQEGSAAAAEATAATETAEAVRITAIGSVVNLVLSGAKGGAGKENAGFAPFEY